MFRKMCSILLFHILIAGYWDLTPIRILINGHQKMEHLSGNIRISQFSAGGAARGVKCDVLTIICPNLVVIRALPPPPRTCRPVDTIFVSARRRAARTLLTRSSSIQPKVILYDYTINEWALNEASLFSTEKSKIEKIQFFLLRLVNLFIWLQAILISRNKRANTSHCQLPTASALPAKTAARQQKG